MGIEMSSWVAQNRENFELLAKFAPKEQIPLSDFYKIFCGKGVLGPYPHAELHGCGFKNAGLQAPNR